MDFEQSIPRTMGHSGPTAIAEENRRTGKDRRYHFRIAAGSAAEVRAAIRIAVSWQYLPAAKTNACLELIDRECAMLWRLGH